MNKMNRRACKRTKLDKQDTFHTERPNQNTTCLIQVLPDDIIRFIAMKHLFYWNDILRLVKTCKQFYRALCNINYKLYYIDDGCRLDTYYYIWETPHFFGWSNGLPTIRLKNKTNPFPHKSYEWSAQHINHIINQIRSTDAFPIYIPNRENPKIYDTVFVTLPNDDNDIKKIYIRELLCMLNKLNQIGFYPYL
jgi:hypothetical protein